MKRAARLVLLASMMLGSGGVARAQDQVRILVPAFSGERQLGLASANLLRLQVSQTFQVAGTPTRAVMIFDDNPLSRYSHDGAQTAGYGIGARTHLVLWGQSYEYPDGVVVRAYLSITPHLYDRARRPEIWTIEVPGGPGIRSALPRAFYEFPEVIVPIDVARHYPNVDALVIYRDLGFTQPIGRFRDVYVAHEYRETAVRLTSGGVTGWVPLPHLVEQRTEIVEFTGGYLRLLRGDWAGARQLFESMLRRDTITPEMRLDGHIFLGLIREKGGQSGLDHFREAMRLNEFDRPAATYLLMGLLAEARRPGTRRRQAIEELRAQLALQTPLFSEDDRWIAAMRQAADAVGRAE
jgi:hypothetical protein